MSTYAALVPYSRSIVSYREHLCGYDLNLSYPQDGHFPTLKFVEPEDPFRSKSQGAFSRLNSASRDAQRLQLRTLAEHAERAVVERREHGAAVGKRDLSGRANGTIDPWYGCDIYDELIDYAVNFSFPWSLCSRSLCIFGLAR